MGATSVKSVAWALLNVIVAVRGGPLEKRQDGSEGYYVPASYPAPYGGWVDDWTESYAKAKKLVDSMTLAEKTNITSGTGIFMGAYLHVWSKTDSI